jgi:hypothetical protein
LIHSAIVAPEGAAFDMGVEPLAGNPIRRWDRVLAEGPKPGELNPRHGRRTD